MKTLITLCIATLALTSCNEHSSTYPMHSENEKIVRQYFKYFNNHNWTEMAAIYVEVSDFKDPSLGQGIVRQTRKQIIEKYTELGNLFPDLKDEIVHIYPSGEKQIIVEFVSTGTGPDGTQFELPICTIFTIENGQITKDFTYYDNFCSEVP